MLVTIASATQQATQDAEPPQEEEPSPVQSEKIVSTIVTDC